LWVGVLQSTMGRDCFNCADGPVSQQYTLSVEDVGVFEHKYICEDCVTGFQRTDWIDVHDAAAFESSEPNHVEKSP
jgi:hypothetical protein